MIYISKLKQLLKYDAKAGSKMIKKKLFVIILIVSLMLMQNFECTALTVEGV